MAIDGGGTKTEYLLLNEEFQVTDRFVGGGSNHERLPDGFEGVFKEFDASISALLERNGLTPADIKDVVAGLSGADNSAQVETREGLLHRGGRARVLVGNDGYLPVAAECSGGIGIAYNCGTGVCCTAIDAHGKMSKIGGLDEWSDDMGGGVWLLQQIFKSVYDDVKLSLKKTELTGRYAALLGIPADRIEAELDESLMRVKEDGELKRQLIAGFFAAYLNGDSAAADIARRMMTRAADYIGAAYRASAFGDAAVQIVLAGSILLKAAPQEYLNAMKAAVESRMGAKACWLIPEHTAAYGAAQWIRLRNT